MERTALLPWRQDRAEASVAEADAARASVAGELTGSGPEIGLGYLPSLDGLRAISVMAVLLYHAEIGWLSGGFLGVEVFFVISGYLITSLLLAERQRSGTISLRGFWVRRARRLLPALYLLLLATSAWWLLFVRDEVGHVRGDVLAAVTYVTNWWLVFSKQSYFAQAGRPSPFRHLWSLAVEEQFYLLWPLIFVGLMALTKGRRDRAVGILLAGAAASAMLMYTLFSPAADPSRPYYGTDTRASGLLLGAALAFVLPPWRLQARAGKRAPHIIDGVGLLALGALAWFFLRVNEFDPFVYQQGFILLDLLTVVAIIAVVHPAGRVWRRALSLRPVVWVGQRSYGIYLWHWPVFVLTRPRLDISLTGVPLLVVRLAITIGLAAASYRFLEQPVRRGALGRVVRRVRDAGGVRRLELTSRLVLSLSAVILLIGGVAIGLAMSSPAHSSPPPGFEDGSAGDTLPPPTRPGATTVPITTGPPSTVPTTVAPTLPPTTPPPPGSSTIPPPGPSSTAPPTTAPVTTIPPPPPTAPVVPAPGQEVSAIGDSVMLGSRSALQARMPGVFINAVVGRQWYQAPEVADALGKGGYLRPVLVVHLGTNGAVTGNALDKLFELLGGKRVLLVNTRVDRPWQDLVNSRLADAAASHPGAVLVDWHAESDGHPEYFVRDGVHLTKAGANAYADLIARNLH